MGEQYYLRYKDTVIGVLIREDKGFSYKVIKKGAKSISNGLGYPVELFPQKYNEGIDLENMQTNEENIKKWLGNRAFSFNKVDANHLLRTVGIDVQNMWKLALHTKAISFNDHYWISKGLKDSYKEVHPRYMLTEAV